MPAPTISRFDQRGQIGATILIEGDSFTGTTAVTIDGHAVASFNVVDDSHLTVVVATGTTNGYIAVTNGTGTTTSADIFHIVTNPFPVGPFGGAPYGVPWLGILATTTIDLSQSALSVGMSLTTIGYGVVQVDWQAPTDDYSNIVLVRNSYGPPTSPVDGQVLLSQPKFAIVQRTVVDADLGVGGWAYYALFIQTDPTTWKRIASEHVLVPRDYQSVDLLLSLLPDFYVVDDSDDVLKHFLSIVGYDMDKTRTMVRTMSDATSPTKLLFDMLPSAAATFGFPYEPNIGGAQTRSIFSRWFEILRMKGTAKSIADFAEAVTGWGADVSSGANLVLNGNDSIAAGVDPAATTTQYWRWHVTNATIARVTSVPHAIPLSGVTTAFSVTASGSTPPAAFLGIVDTKAHVVGTCLPVTEGTTYVFSRYVLANSTVRTFTPKLHWYDAVGTLLSTTTGTGVADSSSAWTRISIIGTAPTGAVYAQFEADWSASAAAEIHFFTGSQFEITIAPTVYDNDTFNRANGAAGSTNGTGTDDPKAWSMATAGAWTISSNTFLADATHNTVAVIAQPSEALAALQVRVQADIAVIGTGSVAVVLNEASDSYYELRVYATGTAEINRVDSGVRTQLAVVTAYSPTVGDTIVLERFGSTLVGFLISGGVQTIVGPTLDDTYYGGSVGVANYGPTWKLDNFIVSDIAGTGFVSTATPFEKPGQVDITLHAPRVNLVRNPSAELNTSYTRVSGATLTRSATYGRDGTHSFKLVSAGGAKPTFVETLVGGFVGAFESGTPYVFAVCHRQPSASPLSTLEATAYVTWFSDLAGTTLVQQDSFGPMPVPSDQWCPIPLIVSSVVPDGVMLCQLSIVFSDNGANVAAAHDMYVDSLVFERNGTGMYFDGDSDPASDDYAWYGEAGLAQSMFFPGKTIKLSRLNSLIGDYMPADCNAVVHLAP